MVTQRRYSVTGDAEALKARSPKLQALDTKVQSTTCGLCAPKPGVATHEHHAHAMDAEAEADVDVEVVEGGDVDADRDDDYSHLALSPPHSRQHSVDCNEHKQGPGLHLTLSSSLASNLNSSLSVAVLQHQQHQSHHLHQLQQLHLQQQQLQAAPAPSTAPTFLTLPPEIRHDIYRHCDELVFAQPLLYCIATAFDKIQHPLAAVSRQVRAEALAIFYSYNTWTIKVEFNIMYDSFQHWIIRLGDGARLLRLVDLSVRGTLFKPKRAHAQSVLLHGQLIQITSGVAASGREELYSPPDGDASFNIDLSEKHVGGRVRLLRNDGTKEAGDIATAHLENMVRVLWEKRRSGTLNGQDWVSMVDQFLNYIGGWS